MERAIEVSNGTGRKLKNSERMANRSARFNEQTKRLISTVPTHPLLQQSK
jgi:hypothetical protein